MSKFIKRPVMVEVAMLLFAGILATIALVVLWSNPYPSIEMGYLIALAILVALGLVFDILVLEVKYFKALHL